VVSPLPALGVLAAAVLYGRAVSRLPRAWPPARTWAFGGGLVGLVVATQGPVSANDQRFSVHAVQHLILAMVAPPLLALGAPVTLALQSSTRRTKRWLLHALHHRLTRTVTHPLSALVVFGATPFALYFTDLYDLTLRNAAVHEFFHLVFLAGGALFFWPVAGVDPVPHGLPHAARLGLVFLAIPFHAFLGIALLSGDDPARRTGGGIIWSSGDVLAIVMLAVVAARWMAADERQAVREDRAGA
jgi:putative copper resistance protein D